MSPKKSNPTTFQEIAEAEVKLKKTARTKAEVQPVEAGTEKVKTRKTAKTVKAETTAEDQTKAKTASEVKAKPRSRVKNEAKAAAEPQVEVKAAEPVRHPALWQTILSWGITGLLIAVLIMVLMNFNPFNQSTASASSDLSSPPSDIDMPAYTVVTPVYTVARNLNIDTSVPDGTRQYPIKYTIEEGDSIFSIAKHFDVEPESILWANYDLLNDDPTFLSTGWKLTIPPTDGIYYEWKEGDTLQKVAEKYYANVDDIINWPGNGLDVKNPVTDNLEYIMIPGGYRELKSWIVAVAYTPGSGATRTVAGAGGCAAPATGIAGSTAFQWPAVNHVLSGFDFSSYHLGIDVASGEGSPVYASDSGTVIYAGWNDSGYGNMIMIDHNNGYVTLYAHLSYVYVGCGSDVYAGSIIGASGSTGKSTGAHLHFEIRYNGSFINPWYVLP